MQMYDIVATGVLGLLVGFWSGRSIRWKMEETEETGEDREERKNTAARQLVREGVTIGSPVNGEIRKRMEETAERPLMPELAVSASCQRMERSMRPRQERY